MNTGNTVMYQKKWLTQLDVCWRYTNTLLVVMLFKDKTLLIPGGVQTIVQINNSKNNNKTKLYIIK